MFGSPILLTLLISGLFLGGGLLGFSLIGFQPTPAPPQAVAQPESKDADLIAATLIIRSAHPLAQVTCEVAGQPVELDRLADNEVEGELSVTSPVELKLHVTWPEGTPETAVLIQLQPDGAANTERTLWAQGSLSQELTFFL